ncbi:MAG: carboxylate--amine ligase [Deltaproteobacteria bacterium]|nr:carboxylate--amine ligase [Deltaproteobacteria bacterium]
MRRWKSKEGMRAVFREHGIPCTEGEPYAGAAKARAFAKRHGFPLVFKPEIGVGAAGAFRVNDDEELNAALEKGGLEGYVVEKFETGRLTTYDGLTDRDGRVVFSTSHLYSAGIMDIVNNKLPMHYYNRREFPDGMEEFGNRIVRAFDLRERFFHIELFDLGDGKYRALEVNFRPPGGFTTDLMNYSADVDVYKLWAEIVATGSAPEQWKFDRAYHACHVSRRDGVSYKYSHEEALKRLGDALVLYRRMPDAFAGAMGNHMYLLRTPDFAELKKLIAVVEART